MFFLLRLTRFFHYVPLEYTAPSSASSLTSQQGTSHTFQYQTFTYESFHPYGCLGGVSHASIGGSDTAGFHVAFLAKTPCGVQGCVGGMERWP